MPTKLQNLSSSRYVMNRKSYISAPFPIGNFVYIASFKWDGLEILKHY